MPIMENRNKNMRSRVAKLPMAGSASMIVINIIYSFSSFLMILSTRNILSTLMRVAWILRSMLLPGIKEIVTTKAVNTTTVKSKQFHASLKYSFF
jgi:hypothetical protein